MIHPKTELRYISKEIGYGVVATDFLPAGTITWVLDELDREFTPTEVGSMHGIYQNLIDIYSYRNNRGNYVLCWDNARYVNHSFKSNCLSTAYDFEIAIRDIHPGEEITDDYGYLNVSNEFTAIDEGTIRKKVYPDDLLKYYEIWDQQLLQHFYKIPILEQALRPCIKPEVWEEIKSVIKGKTPMQSILKLYYPDKI